MELKRSPGGPDARPITGRRRGLLDRPAFQRLLASLDADEGRAAQEYERLRERLILFFTGRQCPEPEDCADETLDRISRRIDEGEQIRDVTRFAYGVARLVASESYSRVRRRRRLLTDFATSSAPGGGDSASAPGSDALECIRSCTKRLPPEDQDVILTYYCSAGRDQQEERRQLAVRLEVSPVALRLRAYRIRRVLHTCTRDCLASRAAGET